MADESDWTDSFFAFDCPVDDADDAPLPAPKPKAARLPAEHVTSTSVPPHQPSGASSSSSSSDGDDGDLVAPSNPFTKAAFNHAVRQARRPPTAAGDPPMSKPTAGSSKSSSTATKTVSSTTTKSKKPDPLRAAFAKQAIAKPPKITDPDPEPSSHPSVIPGQDFFKKTKPAYSIPKSAECAKSSGQLKRKPLSPPVCTGLPKPRLQKPLPPVKPELDRPGEQHSSSPLRGHQQGSSGSSLQDVPLASYLGSLPSSPPLSLPSNTVYEATVPPGPSYQPAFSQSLRNQERRVPSSPPQTFSLNTVYEPAPASPDEPAHGPFTPYIQERSHEEDDAAVESIYASKPSFFDINALPSTPGQPIAQPGRSYAHQPAADTLSFPSFPSPDSSPAKTWSTLKKPQVPTRPYARAEPQKTQYDLPPKGMRMLPGLVPTSNKTAKPHQGRLRAFDPPVPLSEWRASEQQQRSSSPVAFEDSVQRRLPAVRLLHRKYRQL